MNPQLRQFASMDDERAGNAFKDAFDKAMRNAGVRMSASEVHRINRLQGRKFKFVVRVYEYAGDTSRDQFCHPKTKQVIAGANQVKAEITGYDPAVFKFTGCATASSNEYDVTYEQA